MGFVTYCAVLFHPPILVYGMEPDMTREGCSIPVTITLQEATQKNTLLLPYGACDDGAHSQNEKFNLSNYMNGVSVCMSAKGLLA